MAQRDPYSTFGRRYNRDALIAARKKAGFTHAELAFWLAGAKKVATQQVKGFERDRYPSFSILMKICEVLSISLDEIAPRIQVEPRHVLKVKEKPFDYKPEWHWG